MRLQGFKQDLRLRRATQPLPSHNGSGAPSAEERPDTAAAVPLKIPRMRASRQCTPADLRIEMDDAW